MVMMSLVFPENCLGEWIEFGDKAHTNTQYTDHIIYALLMRYLF